MISLESVFLSVLLVSYMVSFNGFLFLVMCSR